MRVCRLCCLAVLAFILVIPAEARDFSADPARVRDALQKASYADPLFDDRLKAQQKALQPIFIIVPGILGSKLKKGDTTVWGEVSLVSGVKREDLEFNEAPGASALTPDFMDRVTIRRLMDVDVYGTLRDDLRFTSITGVPWYGDFPYDWRDDIRQSAERFHAYLEAKRELFKDREVFFIAHSMGGLVVRWWYDAYYRNPEHAAAYGFLRQPRILFVGVPHFGSAAALLRLVQGFAADSAFEGISDFLLRGLNHAGPSFYSVYQILPFNHSAIEFRSLEGQPDISSDLLSVEFWRTCRWGGPIRERDPEKFYGEILPPRLEAARAFRDKLLHQEPIPNAVCFYSDLHENTPLTLRVWQHTKGPCTVSVDDRSPGDGSVPAEITRVSYRPDHPHTAIFRLRSGHMALPNAHGFRSYIHNLRTRVTVRSIVRADPTEKVIAVFRDSRTLFPLPLDITALADPETKLAIDLNRRILGGRDDRERAHRVYEMAERAKDLSEEASQLYALAVALDPQGPHAPFAANNLGHNLLQNDLWFAARGYLEHAQKLIHLVPVKEKKFLARLQKNTASAYEKTGEPCPAIDYFTRASETSEVKRLERETKGNCGT